jgi:uncharacterized protein (TIGR02231 family)
MIIKAQAAITELVVFTDRARVTRSGSVHLAPGQHTITLENLPSTLEEDSVRVRGRGRGVRVLDVSVASAAPHATQADYDAIEAELEELQARHQALIDANKVEEARLDFMKTFRDSSSLNLGRAIAFGKAQLTDVDALTQHLVEELRTIHQRQREIEKERRTVQKRLQELEDRLPPERRQARRVSPFLSRQEEAVLREAEADNETSSRFPFRRRSNPEPFRRISTPSALRPSLNGEHRREIDEDKSPGPDYCVQIEVMAGEETDLSLSIVYVVREAGWEPVYDIRLNDDAINVIYQARIQQHTGEDWPAVTTSLSTARPAASATVPHLRPWYVDRQRPRLASLSASSNHTINSSFSPPPSSRFSRPAAGSHSRLPPGPFSKTSPDIEEDEAASLEETHQVENAAFITGSQPSVTYTAKGGTNVPSDRLPAKAIIVALELEAELDYVTVPRRAEEAYLRARIHNTSEYLMLAGAGYVFRDAEFIGKTQVPTTVPDETFAVQLGADERIQVTHQLVERSTTRAHIGNLHRTQFAYRMTVHNGLGHTARITLFDQLPVSQHEDIRVDVLELLPEPTEQTDQGILRWEFELAPEKTREFMLSFTLEHPRSMNLSGIN